MESVITKYRSLKNERAKAFVVHLSKDKSISTIRGYLSALNNKELQSILYSLFSKDSIFDISNIDDLQSLYTYICGSKLNITSHSRYTAAINNYINFIKNTKEENGKI